MKDSIRHFSIWFIDKPGELTMRNACNVVGRSAHWISDVTCLECLHSCQELPGAKQRIAYLSIDSQLKELLDE